MRLAILAFLALPLLAVSNKVTVSSQSGSTQTDRPTTIPRYFAQDEICNYPQPYVSGVAVTYWQAEVYSRWAATASCPGGAVQMSTITAQLASIPTTGVEVEFRNSTNRSSSGDDAATTAASLSKAQMLAFNGGVWPSRASYTLGGTVTHVTSAKTMLTNDHYKVLEAGPMRKTLLIREGPDAVSGAKTRTTSFGAQCTANCTAPYDTATWADNATYYSIRPSYVVTFYSKGDGSAWNVETDFIADNGWLDRAQDQRITAFVAYRDDTGSTAGYTAPAVLVFPHASRLFEPVWASAPAAVHIDLNFPYLHYSKVIPSYGLDLVPHASAETNELNWSVATGGLGFDSATCDQGETVTVGSSPHMGKGQYAFAGMQSADPGARPDIGILPRWDAKWVMRQTPDMLRVVLGNAKAAFHVPIHYLETKDVPWDDAGLYSSFGRWPNPRSRPTFSGYLLASDAADKMVSPSGAVIQASCNPPDCMVTSSRSTAPSALFSDTASSSNVNSWAQDMAHATLSFFAAYLATGKYAYVEGMQAHAQWAIMYSAPGTGGGAENGLGASSVDYLRWNHPNTVIYANGNTVRGHSWVARNLAAAAHFSWTGTAERDYFQLRLSKQLDFTRGRLNLDAAGRTCVGYGAAQAQDPATDIWKLGRCWWEGYKPNPLEFVNRKAIGSNHFCFGCAMSANTGNSSYGNWQQAYFVLSHGLISDWGYSAATSIARAGARLMMRISADRAVKSPLFSVMYYIPQMQGGDDPNHNYIQSIANVYAGKVHSAPISRGFAAGDTSFYIAGVQTTSSSFNATYNQMEFQYMSNFWFKVDSEYIKVGSVTKGTTYPIQFNPTTGRIALTSHGYADGDVMMIVGGIPDAGIIGDGSRCLTDRRVQPFVNCWFYAKAIDANTIEPYSDAALTTKITLSGPPSQCVTAPQVHWSFPGGTRTLYTCETPGGAWSSHAFTESTSAVSGACTTGSYHIDTDAVGGAGAVYHCESSYWSQKSYANKYPGDEVGDPWVNPMVARSTVAVAANCGTGAQSCRGGFGTTAASHNAASLIETSWANGGQGGYMPTGSSADFGYGVKGIAAMAYAVNLDAEITDSVTGNTISARRAYEIYYGWSRYMENVGGPRDCSAASYGNVDCGNPQWSVRPRPRITNVTVTPTVNSLIFTYTAPSTDICRIGVSATAFASTDESGDTSDSKVKKVRQTTIGSLSGATTYNYRITCGPSGTARVSGTATTL